MPAKSKSQQRLFGMVHAYNKGKLHASRALRRRVAAISRRISDADAKHFAKTKHDGLPEKKAEPLAEYAFDIGDNGLDTRSRTKDFSGYQPHVRDWRGRPVPIVGYDGGGKITRLRQADGTVKYVVGSSFYSTLSRHKDEAGRVIPTGFTVVTDSPYKAMRLARGHVELDPETRKLIDAVQVSEGSLGKEFAIPKSFRIQVLKPGRRSSVLVPERADVRQHAPNVYKILKRLAKLHPGKAKLLAGGALALPVVGGALYKFLGGTEKKAQVLVRPETMQEFYSRIPAGDYASMAVPASVRSERRRSFLGSVLYGAGGGAVLGGLGAAGLGAFIANHASRDSGLDQSETRRRMLEAAAKLGLWGAGRGAVAGSAVGVGLGVLDKIRG